jgi:putative ABC transport system permease protein
MDWIRSLGRDLRYGVRALAKAPGFSLAVAGVLALGIGVNTVMFSMVDAVLLRPLPFSDSGRLVSLFHVPPQKSFPGVKLFSVSAANYLDWKKQSHSFESMAVFGFGLRNLTGLRSPEALRIGRVEPDFFSLLRANAAIGRTFRREESQPDRANVVVVSHRFWKSHLGPDPLGQTVLLDGARYTVIGVMPPGFSIPAWTISDVPVWVPLVWSDKDRAVRGNHNYGVVARLKPGVDVTAARAEMDAISSRLAAQYPVEDAGWGATAIPLYEQLVGDVRTSLLVLLGAVAFVLLIACANVANLVLARSVSRRKEMAIRTALGASRGEVVQQVLLESLLLSLAGGAIAVLTARALFHPLAAFLEGQIPRADEVTLDGRVLLFAIFVSILTGLLAGLFPALRAAKAGVNEALKQGMGRGGAESGGLRARRLLVVSEVALSLMLLAGAGLMIRSLWNLSRVDAGIDPHNVLTMDVALPMSKYDTPPKVAGFFDPLLERVRALPGVEAAGLIDTLPLAGGGSMQPVTFEGRAAGLFAEQPEVAVRAASPGYLQTMHLPLLRGRDFREGDINAVLVSDSMAKRFWPSEDPVGQRMGFSFVPGVMWQVIGVVADVKQEELSVREPAATAYQWSHDRRRNSASLAIRTSVDPASLTQPVIRTIQEMDPDLPVQNVDTMEHIVSQSLAQERFTMQLLSAFAAIALLLAGAGIYAVVSYAVRQRTHEIGIRTALGALVQDILRMVLTDAMKPVLLGMGAGLAGALALGRVLDRLIFGVQASDPLTYAAVALVLTAVALMAGVVPAWRAARVDSLRALRDE